MSKNQLTFVPEYETEDYASYYCGDYYISFYRYCSSGGMYKEMPRYRASKRVRKNGPFGNVVVPHEVYLTMREAIKACEKDLEIDRKNGFITYRPCETRPSCSKCSILKYCK